MAFNSSSPGTPLYREVRRQVLEALARGDWQPGERLPNEVDLAERFGVAVSTIRAGVRELTAAGVLVRRQGKGTFVARHDFARQQFRFSNVYDGEQKKVVTHRHITGIKRALADGATCRLLQLDATGSPEVHQISATLNVGEKRVALMELVLPVAKFPRLRQKDLEQGTENLYAVYQRGFGITVVRMEEKVYAKTASAALAAKLRLKVGHPILSVERVAFSFNDMPVEIRRRLYEGTAHYYLFVHDRLD